MAEGIYVRNFSASLVYNMVYYFIFYYLISARLHNVHVRLLVRLRISVGNAIQYFGSDTI